MDNKKSFLGLLLITLFISKDMNSQNNTNLIQPNVIIFYADDLGWQDIQLNDLDEPCAWDTPNISKLAEDAINFTNGYSPAPTCAPSRSAILSGLHPAKTGITNVNGGGIPKSSKSSKFISPFFPSGLMPEHLTIAEALKMNGYKTGHVGKWHAGHLKIQSSKNQGFDFVHESRGAHQGPKKPHNRLTRFATDAKNDSYRLSKEKYFPFTKESPKGISYPKDEVTENALKFITENKNKPFFLYLAHWMVHYPIHTKNRKLLQYYCDKLGIDFPEEDIPMTKGGQNNPYFGAMVTTLDWSLGRVVDLLKKTNDPRNPGKKLYETTYILFSSDNGGAEKRRLEVMSDNAPLDKGKKYPQEGGIRVPMLISGPNVSKGKTHDVLINQLDFFPTILNLTNSTIPTKYASNLDGLDVSGVLLNKEEEVIKNNGKPREDLWWHYPYSDTHNQSALRFGDYKFYKNLIKGDYELYRLYKDGKREDIEEQHNIVAEEPELVKDLTERLDKYLKDSNAKFPYKDPTRTKDALEKENLASIPIINSDAYNNKSGELSVTLRKNRSKVIECYGLIKIQDKATFRKNGKKNKVKSTYIKIDVDENKKNLKYSLKVPKEAIECGIIFIDEHRFMVKSEFHKIK